MTDNVAAPVEPYVVLQAETDGLPDISIINTALDHLASSGDYPWHLSIIVEMLDTFENGIPTKPEQIVVRALDDAIRLRLKADGNALWVANITWNGTRQFVYRVRDPEIANAYLSTLVQDGGASRALEYEMEKDADWGFAAEYLESARRFKAEYLEDARVARESSTAD